MQNVNLESDEWNVQLQSVGENLAKATENASMLIESSPLWIKLSIGGSLLLYVYVRQKWTALNNCGIDVLTPKEWIKNPKESSQVHSNELKPRTWNKIVELNISDLCFQIQHERYRRLVQLDNIWPKMDISTGQRRNC